MKKLTTEELRPIRLELALALLEASEEKPLAKKMLHSILEEDPKIKQILNIYTEVQQDAEENHHPNQ